MIRIYPRLSPSTSKGAGRDWFTGSSKSNRSFYSSLRLFLFCLSGVMMINFFFRGNPLGRCHNESEVMLPFGKLSRRTRYRELMAPEGYGFVDGNEEVQQWKKIKERKKKKTRGRDKQVQGWGYGSLLSDGLRNPYHSSFPPLTLTFFFDCAMKKRKEERQLGG